MVKDEVKRYRLNALYSRRELGELLGFHGRTAESVIQKWEDGSRCVPLKHFRKLHEILGIPYEKLIP